MSQRDGFASGFFAGAIFGSVVGGVVGALAAQRRNGEELASDETEQKITDKSSSKLDKSGKRRQMRGAATTSGVEMEVARRSLEDKIAQLNATIDEVRDRLGSVNNTSEVNELSSRSEELQS